MTAASYTIIPRRFSLVSPRSKVPYWDRIILSAEIRSRAYGPGDSRLWPPAKAAYLGFMGAGKSIALTDDLWGVVDGWRMAVPDAGALNEDEALYVGFTAMNIREFPDDKWREYVLKVAAIGSGIALGKAIDVPGTLVAAAAELGISGGALEVAKQLGLSGVLNAAEDWVSGLFASPPSCVGVVFSAEYPIDPYRLDRLSFQEGTGDPFRRIRRQTLSQERIPPMQAGCGRPDGFIEFDIEQYCEMPFGPQRRFGAHDQIAEVMAPPSAVPTGMLVDEKSVLSPQPNVQVRITPRKEDNADFFDITIWEYEFVSKVRRLFFTASFTKIFFEVGGRYIPSRENVYGQRRADEQEGDPSLVPVGKGGPHWGGIDLSIGKLLKRTLCVRMTAPDGSVCDLSLWRSSTTDDRGKVSWRGDQLYFERDGTSTHARTAVWLDLHNPVR